MLILCWGNNSRIVRSVQREVSGNMSVKMMRTPLVSYLRRAHGGYKVEIWMGVNMSSVPLKLTPVYYTVHKPKSLFGLEEKSIRFDSFRQMFLAHTNKEPTMSWRRYFKLESLKGLKQKKGPKVTVLDLLSPDSDTCGIDLSEKHKDIARILYAKFWRHIQALRLDPEDVLQEVYRGILVRNDGTCPWDASKGSFGSYVFMVCHCVLSNLSDRQKRKYGKEYVGIPENLEIKLSDDANPVQEEAEAIASLQYWIKIHGRGNRDDLKLASEIAPLVYQGYRRSEIAEKIGRSKAQVSRALSHIREHGRAWAEAQA